jgi:hypothetical protein
MRSIMAAVFVAAIDMDRAEHPERRPVQRTALCLVNGRAGGADGNIQGPANHVKVGSAP